MRWISSTAVRQRSNSRSWSGCGFSSGFAGSLAKLDVIKWVSGNVIEWLSAWARQFWPPRRRKRLVLQMTSWLSPVCLYRQRPRLAGRRCDACHINEGPYGAGIIKLTVECDKFAIVAGASPSTDIAISVSRRASAPAVTTRKQTIETKPRALR